MKIGMAGPITLSTLHELLPDCPPIAPGLRFDQAAFMAAELVGRGYEVAIFALDPERTVPASYRGKGWEIHVAPFRKRPRDRARDLFRTERRALVEAIRPARCDLVHASWSYEFAWAALASRRPTLTTFHDWAPAILRLYRDPYRAARLLMTIRTLASRSRFTAVSPYIARQLKRYTRTAPAVIPNSISPHWPSSNDSERSRCDSLILSVNNGWNDLKNVSTLLRSFPVVRAARPDVRLVLVGQGYEQRGAAQEWAQSHALTDSVEFRGPLSSADIAALMSEATLLAHPSRQESFGIVLIEAMASELAIVGGHKSGGVPWVLDEGRAGLLTDIRDPSALAASIIDLLESPSRRAELVRSGLQRVQEEFSLTAVTEAYVSEYNQVVEIASGG